MLFDALEYRLAPVFQLAQIAQPVFQFTQLHVVKSIGGFLAVARDKRNGRAAVEKVDRSFDLLFLNADFGGNLPNDFLHV